MIEPANKRRIDDPGKVNQYQGDSPEATRTQPRANFSSLGKTITNWTSNLVATAIVVVIALTFGSQLVSSWVPRGSLTEASEFEISQTWPTLQACSLEFGDSPFRLTREAFAGSESDVISFLQNRCREELENDAQPVGEIGQRESKMISHSVDRTPIEQVEGKWRIFLGPKLDESQPLPIAIGIRDNCRSYSATATEPGKSESRLVVWAMAMPVENDGWTTFVAQASTLNSTLGLEQLLPITAKRTMAMTDPAGGSIIGFSDGDFDSAIAFYRVMAKKRNGILEIDPPKNPNSWSARILPAEDSQIKGLQVQLTLDHNKNLTGILLVQSNQVLADKTTGNIESPK